MYELLILTGKIADLAVTGKTKFLKAVVYCYKWINDNNYEDLPSTTITISPFIFLSLK